LLATLRRRFGIKEAVFVFDGGMSSKVNLETIEALQLKYVTRLGAAMLDQLIAQLPADQSPELWDRTQVMEIVREGKRYVIAGGPWRRQRDQERRAARLAKAETELQRIAAVPRKQVDAQKLASQVGRTLQRLKAHKYFDYSVTPQGQLQWHRRADAIRVETVRDGLYLLGTSTAPQQVAAPNGAAGHRGRVNQRRWRSSRQRRRTPQRPDQRPQDRGCPTGPARRPGPSARGILDTCPSRHQPTYRIAPIPSGATAHAPTAQRF
jgi:hypothetical protein